MPDVDPVEEKRSLLELLRDNVFIGAFPPEVPTVSNLCNDDMLAGSGFSFPSLPGLPRRRPRLSLLPPLGLRPLPRLRCRFALAAVAAALAAAAPRLPSRPPPRGRVTRPQGAGRDWGLTWYLVLFCYSYVYGGVSLARQLEDLREELGRPRGRLEVRWFRVVVSEDRRRVGVEDDGCVEWESLDEVAM